jgi:hypothetical protein
MTDFEKTKFSRVLVALRSRKMAASGTPCSSAYALKTSHSGSCTTRGPWPDIKILFVSPLEYKSTAGCILETAGQPKTKHRSTGAGSSLRNRNFVNASLESKKVGSDKIWPSGPDLESDGSSWVAATIAHLGSRHGGQNALVHASSLLQGKAKYQSVSSLSPSALSVVRKDDIPPTKRAVDIGHC